MKWFNKKTGIGIILLVSLLSYMQTLSYGFVYDDAFFTPRQEFRSFSYLPNVFIEPLAPNNPTAGTFRPLPMATVVATYALFGESPITFHATNIVLHAIVSVFVFLVGLALGIPFAPSFFGALLFAVHPIHTETVANIKSRDELLFGLFFLLSIWFLKKSRKKWYLGSFFLALLSKEMAVVIPIILVSIAYVGEKMPPKKLLLVCLSFIPFFVVYLVLRSVALGPSLFGEYTGPYPGNLLYDAPFLVRLLTGFHIYTVYLTKLLFPLHLSANYGYKAFVPTYSLQECTTWIPGAVLVIGGIVSGVIAWKRRSVAVFSLLFMWYVLYLMISQIPFAKGDIIAERWIYVPSIPFLLILSYGLFRLIRRGKVYIPIISLIVLILMVRTIVRNPVWESNQSLFERMVHDAPQSVMAHTALSEEYVKVGNITQAKNHAGIAETIYPDYAPLQNVLGNLAMLDRRYDAALVHYEKSIKIDPQLTETYKLLGSLSFATGAYQKAEEYFTTVIGKQHVIQFEDRISYAAVLAKLQRYQESLAVLSDLPKEDNVRPQAQFLFAVNYYKLGNMEKVAQYIHGDKQEQMLKEF